MRVGIIGGGQIAKIHGPLILQQADTKIVGIADGDLARAKSLATELKVAEFYQSAKVMIDEERPDVVHVLAPPQYHAELSILAMNQGCHVLVEKPMALTVADAERMIAVAEQNKVRLCVDHNMIFVDLIQNALGLIANGLIGDVVSVEACYLYDVKRYPAILEKGAEYCHWSYQLNGGPLQDQIPHPASLVMEFVPVIRDVHWIEQNRGVLPEGWHDEVRVLIKSDTVIGYISVSLSEKPDTFSLTIKGTKGTIDIDLFTNILIIQTRSGLPRAVARGISGLQLTRQYLRGSLCNIWNFATGRIDKSNGIGPLISRFYESIRKGGEAPVSLGKSLRVVNLTTRIWPVPARPTKPPHTSNYATNNKNGRPIAFVTGASGFIGIHLVKKLLSENYSVRALVRPNSIHAGRLKGVDVDVVEGNLGDAQALYEAVKGTRVIYHAGATTEGNNWEEHYQSTVKGTEYLIKAALAHQVERVVHLSTLAVYEPNGVGKDTVINEDSPYRRDPNRMGPYASAKIAAETLMFDAYRKDRLAVTVVRPGMVIGPWGRVFFPHFGYRVEDKLFIVIGKGDVICPFTYVENVVDGIYNASIERAAVGQAYNLVDDGSITVKEYLERFIEITGRPARIVSVPYFVPYLVTLVYEMGAHFEILKKRKDVKSPTKMETSESTLRQHQSKK